MRLANLDPVWIAAIEGDDPAARRQAIEEWLSWWAGYDAPGNDV
jgi:hypothetical protein